MKRQEVLRRWGHDSNRESKEVSKNTALIVQPHYHGYSLMLGTSFMIVHRTMSKQ